MADIICGFTLQIRFDVKKKFTPSLKVKICFRICAKNATQANIFSQHIIFRMYKILIIKSFSVKKKNLI